jgi:hypothetical protein
MSAFPKLNSYLKPDAMWAMQIVAKEDRFVTKEILSLQEVHKVRHLRQNNLGNCWFYIPFCDLDPHLSGISDDFEIAYSKEGVGESEPACLQRARFHWELCGGNPTEAVTALYYPTGATHSFPDERAVALARQKEAGIAAGERAAPGGWKTVRVYVGDTTYGGVGRPESHELSFRGGRVHAWMGQCLQDFWVMKALGFQERGYFIDLAAYDALHWSNTASLEQFYDWDGLCVEPMERHFWGLR